MRLAAEHDLYTGMRLYRQHAVEMLRGDDLRPWQCLGGSKFLYVNAAGEVQLCSQNRACRKPLHAVTQGDLRANNRHKACEPGCALGCVRLVSHALGAPLTTLATSLPLVARFRPSAKPVAGRATPVTSVPAPRC